MVYMSVRPWMEFVGEMMAVSAGMKIRPHGYLLLVIALALQLPDTVQ